MPSQCNQVVIEDPPAELVSTMGEVLKRGENGRWDLYLVVSESALDEVIEVCLSNELRFSVSPTTIDVTGSTSFSQHPPSTPHSDTDRVPPGESVTPVPNGGELRDPDDLAAARYRIPERAEYRTTTEWLASTADYIGVEMGALQEIVSTYSEEADLEQKRRTLELVFTQHLERASKGEHAFVDIRFGNEASSTRYHYLDNGPGRGGAHLFECLNDQQRADVTHLSSAEGLDVLAEGEGFVSVSYGYPATTDDVRFAEQVISEVFDASLAGVVRIEEIIDREETRRWLG